MTPTSRLSPWANPACVAYLVVGLIAASMIVMAIAERTIGLFAIVPTIVAVAGLVFGWVNAPVFVLLAVAIALLIAQPMFLPNSHLVDMILAGSILAYIIAHYRLCSLTTLAFPPDTRKPLTRTTAPIKPALPAFAEFLMALTIVPYLVYLALRKPPSRRLITAERRAVTELPPEEVVWVLVAVGCCAGTALAIWLVSYWRPAPLNTIARQWQLGMILWIVVLPILFWTAVASYWRWRRATPMEARLALSEELWKETRREQRRIARWAVWARQRQEREASS